MSVAAVAVLAAVTGTALASGGGAPGSAGAPIGGEVPGLTGTAAQRAAGAAADRFRQITNARIAAHAAAVGPGAPAAAVDLHDAWGIFFNDRAASGLQATHSVYTITTRNDFIYAPTALPPGNACTELTTAYTPSGPLLWAWDWCGGRDAIGKTVKIDSTFLATYTTTVNGQSAYTMQEVQTSASSNAWTVYLMNYTTHAWDTFYATSGSKDIPGSTWDFFEIYTSAEPGAAGEYCTTANGRAFEASSVQVSQNGTWTPANTSNSSLSNPPPGSSFDCPAMTFSVVHPNDHWQARIGAAPPTTTPPTTAPPTTAPPTTAPPTTAPPTTTRPTTAPPTTGGSAGCTATYSQVNSWQGGFQGNVTVTAGGAGVNGWTVHLTLPAGATVSQLWNGALSGTAPNYTVRNQSYNGALAAGSSTQFGFIGTGTATTPTVSCMSP